MGQFDTAGGEQQGVPGLHLLLLFPHGASVPLDRLCALQAHGGGRGHLICDHLGPFAVGQRAWPDAADASSVWSGLLY